METIYHFLFSAINISLLSNQDLTHWWSALNLGLAAMKDQRGEIWVKNDQWLMIKHLQNLW